jgi:Ran GTPase-activating protein (RanGAP) involved in mRNA processing and transport
LALAPLPIAELKKSTEELDLSFKDLNFEDVFVVIQLVKSIPELEILNLSGNPIGNEGIEVIAESLNELHLTGIKCYDMNIQFDATLR